MIDAFNTIAVPAHARITRKRSRFLATVSPVDSKSTIDAELHRIQHQFHDASHHCYAYRLFAEPAPYEFSSDAGEPPGSAGAPILQQLQGAGLLNILAVVVRYFGGVKLGIGGLVRAYSEAVSAALVNAEPVRRAVRIDLRVSFPPETHSAVMSTIHRHPATVRDIDYDDCGHVVLSLPPSGVRGFVDALREATGARAQVEGFE